VPVEIEFTDAFEGWWNDLTEGEQARVAAGVVGSRHAHMRELRVQVEGSPYRVLYAFNPLRNAILLLGGDKRGDQRWYDVNVPVADGLYDEHLIELKKEGLL
jgi:hypothetical protein